MTMTMTIEEAANILGLSRRRVRQLAQQKRISAKKIHERMYLLDPSSVKRFAATGRRPPGRPKET